MSQENSYGDVRATERTSMDRLRKKKGVQVVNHGSERGERSNDRYNTLRTRTLDRVDLPECVVSTMSGPSPDNTGQNTKDTHPVPDRN